jgi:hypothetical protein
MLSTPKWRIAITVAVFVGIILVWLATPFIIRYFYPNLSDRGQVGDLFGSVNALFSGLAFAGVLYAIFQQHAEFNRQVELTRDGLYASHRPKIRIKHLQLTRNVQPNERIIVDLTYVNTGTAEAILSQFGLKFLIVRADNELPNEFAIPHIYQFPNKAKLVCGKNWSLPSIDSMKVLTSGEVEDIRTSRSKLYCVGWLSYEDLAGRMRITGFCRRMDGDLTDSYHARFRKVDDPDYEYED